MRFTGWPGLVGAASLLVNASFLGAYGHPPLTLELARLRPDAVVCDLNYVPLESELLRAARARGLRASPKEA